MQRQDPFEERLEGIQSSLKRLRFTSQSCECDVIMMISQFTRRPSGTIQSQQNVISQEPNATEARSFGLTKAQFVRVQMAVMTFPILD